MDQLFADFSVALQQSELDLNSIRLLFGDDFPSSLMRAKKPKQIQSFKDRSYQNTKIYAKEMRDPRQLPCMRKAYTIAGQRKHKGANLTLSTFPQNIGRSMVLFYTEPGQTIVDPFAGHNSRMELCVKCGRNYLGQDLSARFMKFNWQRQKQLLKQYPGIKIELWKGDSRKLPFDDEVGDFTITSPPYYRQEYYGPEKDQLGELPSYGKFLFGLRKVIRENFRCLKPGARAVWFVNDFRWAGKFRPYHCDVMRLGQEERFALEDVIVVDLGRTIIECYVSRVHRMKLIPKRHEYGVIFRKE